MIGSASSFEFYTEEKLVINNATVITAKHSNFK